MKTAELSSTDDTWESTTPEWEPTTELSSEKPQPKESKRLSLEIQEIKRDQKNYRLFIKMKNRLEKGKSYTIDIQFSGEILNDLRGLYKTSYVDLDGTTK